MDQSNARVLCDLNGWGEQLEAEKVMIEESALREHRLDN